MPSADFCLITSKVTYASAIGFASNSLSLDDTLQRTKALINQSLTGIVPIAC
jgi:hypothetical protein